MSKRELGRVEVLVRVRSRELKLVNAVSQLRYHNRWFQLEGQSRHSAPTQGRVLMCEGRHGSMAIEYRGRSLRWQEIPAPAKLSVAEAKPAVEQATEPKPPAAKRKWVPPANHPWREAARRRAQKRAASEAAVTVRPWLAWPCASP